jgi:hypothetical protein
MSMCAGRGTALARRHYDRPVRTQHVGECNLCVIHHRNRCKKLIHRAVERVVAAEMTGARVGVARGAEVVVEAVPAHPAHVRVNTRSNIRMKTTHTPTPYRQLYMASPFVSASLQKSLQNHEKRQEFRHLATNRPPVPSVPDNHGLVVRIRRLLLVFMLGFVLAMVP